MLHIPSPPPPPPIPSHALILSASALGSAATSAHLARQFAADHQLGGGTIDWRDLSVNPPPPLDSSFVAGAFTRPEKRDAAMREALRYSDREIAALKSADMLVIATPVYNFGVPALLKSWFDQIIRPSETFASTGDPQSPYRGLVAVRHCLILTTRGSDTFASRGPMAHWNFLDPHLNAMLALIGIDAPHHIDCSGIDDRPDDRSALIAEAQTQISAWFQTLPHELEPA